MQGKGFILPLILVAVLGVLTMLGFIPAFLGAPAMLIIVVIKDVIFMTFARGLPMAIISTRMMGGLLWAVVKKTGEIVVDKFVPQAGMVFTKIHGAFTIMSERVYRMGGVPIGFAPENAGYNIGFDHVNFVKELRNRGINDIREIADVNDYGQITGLNDDSRIKDIKEKIKITPEQVDLSGFNDFYRYMGEAANPYHQDANIKLGIAQGTLGGEKSKTGLYGAIGLIVFLSFLGVGLLYMLMGGGGGEQIVRVITDNGGTAVIPV